MTPAEEAAAARALIVRGQDAARTSLLVPPRFATPRDPTLATYGPAVAKVAAAMGTPLMPWQRLVADVAGEVLPSGRFRHPLVVISVPRQSGKTTLVQALGVHRALAAGRRRVWYTAQTGKDAAEKWAEMVDVIRADGSPLRDLTLKERKTNGKESLPFCNGSTFAPHPPTKDGLHGKQSDLNLIDEAWSHDEPAGRALMQAIVPTQTTRPTRQTIILSTVGDAASSWFHRYVDRGLQGDGVALFDWGVDREIAADDLAAIAAVHPAYGFTLDDQALIDARAQIEGDGEFVRAYGNLRTGASERTISAPAWLAGSTLDRIPLGSPVAFGVAVAEDRSDAAIVVGAVVDGRPLFEVVDNRPGTSWVTPRLLQLVGKWRVGGRQPAVAIDRIGPAGNVAQEAEKAKVELVPLSTALVAAGVDDVLARLVETHKLGQPARLGYRPHEGLDGAVAVAVVRNSGDGGKLWHRRGSIGSIATLEAMTLAAVALRSAPAAPEAPLIAV